LQHLSVRFVESPSRHRRPWICAANLLILNRLSVDLRLILVCASVHCLPLPFSAKVGYPNQYRYAEATNGNHSFTGND